MRFIGNGGHAKVIRSILDARQSHDAWATYTIVAVGDNAARKREAGYSKGPFAILVHPFSWVAPDVKIGEGTVIMAGAIVQAGVVIGDHVIVNTGVSIDHDCTIGDFAHIAPGAHLCGHVSVGAGALVGVGAVAVPEAVIEPWSLVKAGGVAK